MLTLEREDHRVRHLIIALANMVVASISYSKKKSVESIEYLLKIIAYFLLITVLLLFFIIWRANK